MSLYKFKPFEFTADMRKHCGPTCPSVTTCVGSNNAYFFVYGYKAHAPVVINGKDLLPTRKLWKYCIDLEEWRITTNKDVPQDLSSISSVLCDEGAIITFGRTRDLFGALSIYRLYLGNLGNDRKGRKMKLKEFELNSDIPSVSYKSYAPSVVMDGKYVYSLDYKSDGPSELEVQRLDLSSKKWEILVKKSGVCPELDHSYQEKIVFYKDAIYVFGSHERNCGTDENVFMKIMKFDVVKKVWEVLPVNPNAWPLISNQSGPSCVQYPAKSNLVYAFGTSYGGVWRFDLNNLHWENLKREIPMVETTFRFIAVAPSGRVCFYGETYSDCGNDKCIMTSGWLTIPKLKYISWEAMKHYFKEQMFADSLEHLKEIGISEEFYRPIIEMRRTKLK